MHKGLSPTNKIASVRPGYIGRRGSVMRRREFITLFGGAAAVGCPFAARAEQSGRMRRIGVLLPAVAADPVWQTRLGAFLQGLAVLGRALGRHRAIGISWGTPSPPASH